MDAKIKVLFVCIHNSARSQMAEAYLKKFGEEKFEVDSAGIEPGELNPLVIKVMKEDGIDISENSVDDVFEFFKEGRRYNYLITVCDEAAAQRCPIFPFLRKRISWSFEDPSSFEGTDEEKLERTRIVRVKIKDTVKKFVEETKRRNE